MTRFMVLALALLTLGYAVAPSRPGPFLSPKVLVVNYDPAVRSEGNRPLHAVFGWNDPRVLAEGYISDLKECSGGYLRYRISEWIDADEYPVKIDGFRYTEEQYLRNMRSRGQWHQPDSFDYKAFIGKYALDRRVARGEIDEVWVMGMPYTGLWESTMAGRGAYFCNSDPVPNVDCPKIFVIMGFNYERGVGEMLEDYGHRTESIMQHVYGSWEPKKTHAWNRFTLYDKQMPGEAACGNVHFAPNSLGDYEWGSKKFVMSSCDDWLDYPKLTGKKRLMNADDWGNGGIRAHHKWWLHRLPKAPGRGPDGKLANWWSYVSDFNRYPESNGRAK